MGHSVCLLLNVCSTCSHTKVITCGWFYLLMANHISWRHFTDTSCWWRVNSWLAGQWFAITDIGYCAGQLKSIHSCVACWANTSGVAYLEVKLQSMSFNLEAWPWTLLISSGEPRRWPQISNSQNCYNSFEYLFDSIILMSTNASLTEPLSL